MPLDVQQAWQRYFSPVREKCRRVLGDTDEANDVAQETFIRFWKFGASDEPRVALAWLYRTATRLSVDRLRQRAVHARPVPGAAQAADLALTGLPPENGVAGGPFRGPAGRLSLRQNQ